MRWSRNVIKYPLLSKKKDPLRLKDHPVSSTEMLDINAKNDVEQKKNLHQAEMKTVKKLKIPKVK
jgi:hypothetical protein